MNCHATAGVGYTQASSSVVHGVDPAVLTEEAVNKQSELDESLPNAATLPAACGTLTASQMDGMPEGGADTGVSGGSSGQGVAMVAGADIMRHRPTES